MSDSRPATAVSFVAGEPAAAAGEEIGIVDPASGARFGTLFEADAAAVDRAVGAARDAFDRTDWPRWPTERRQALLMAIHDRILAEAGALADLECAALGVPLRELRERHMRRAAYNFRFFSEFIGQLRGDVWDQTDSYRTIVVREPVGVAALIAPWNAPTALASMKVAAALAFGDTAVLKPSEETPLALARFVEILHEAGVPPGVLNLVNGRGAVTGAALVSHPGVDLVSFTGGTETGREIMAAAGRRLVPTTMELGGKSANVVFASADRERALDAALASIYSNNGQQCLAGSRILVERSIADGFIADFASRARRIRVGDPRDEATEMGPLASATHRARVLSYAERARADGLEILAGGGVPTASPPRSPRASSSSRSRRWRRTMEARSAGRRSSARSPPSRSSTTTRTRSRASTTRRSASSPTCGPTSCRRWTGRRGTSGAGSCGSTRR